MSPFRSENGKKVWIENWGGHVDEIIRQAQARGEFDNLPGAGQPLSLEEDNPWNAEWASAFRLAKQHGAAPRWIELEKEIGWDAAAMQTMLERAGRSFQQRAARLTMQANHVDLGTQAPVAGEPDAPPPAPPSRRWWPFGRQRGGPQPERPPVATAPESLAELEKERRRARALYLSKAADLDKKIQEYNSHRPRALYWLEKPRLLPAAAAQRFDAACPPLVALSPAA